MAVIVLMAVQVCSGQRYANWRGFRVADGLADHACSSLTIGSQGKVLVTHPGVPLITILDGYTVTNVPSPRLRSGPVYESPAGQLWCMSPEGLQELRDGEWRLHPPAELGLETPLAAGASGSTATKPVAETRQALARAALCPVRQGQVLLLLPDRLLEFNSEGPARTRIAVLRFSRDAGIGTFLGMTPSHDGGLWIAGATGLAKLQGPVRTINPETEWKQFLPPPGFAVRNFQAPLEDGAGGVTLVAEASTNSAQAVVVTFDGQNWLALRPANEKPEQAWRGPDNTVWAMAPGALLHWSGDRLELVEENDLSARQFYDVAVESGGPFWLATSDALFRYTPLIWQTPPESRNVTAPVRCLAPDRDGRIWSVRGNGLYALQEGREREFPFPRGVARTLQATTDIYPLKDGSLLLEAGRELYQFSPLTGAFKPVHDAETHSVLKPVGFLKSGVLAMQKRGADSVRADVPQALQVFDGNGFGAFPLSLPETSIGANISKVFATQNGDVWLAAEFGTAWFHEKKWRLFVSRDKTTPESGLDFAEMPNGRIWCATQDRVWEFDGKDWLNMRGGFDRISALLAARDGSLWVASSSSLFRFFQHAWVENGIEEGLPSAAVRGLCEDKNEDVWVATSSGLSRYRPRADLDPPRTTLQSLTEQEKSVPESGAIRLFFSAQDKWKVTPRPRLLYSCKLDGADWSTYQEATSISFSDLAPGKHYFQVRAMDRNCNVDPAPASIEFAVVLPWYREARLVLISGAGVAAVLFFAALAVNRHRRLVRSHAEVENRIAERTRELELANRELFQSQKMNALGTLAAGIAHDFNNILSIIKGSAQIIEENLENPEKVRTRLDRIKTVVEQGSGIVKAMLGFSRESDQQSGPCDLNSAVQDTIKLLGDRFLREVEVRFDPAAGLPPVPCSKDFVQQILLNFIFNAAESMTRTKQILINSGAREMLPAGLALMPAQAPRYACISVQDHGSGISPENLPRIFEPFFTTKSMSVQRGTGLGLSMAYELARKMGAGLMVESVVNQGSTFSLILPIHEIPANSEQATLSKVPAV